jgi:hypothetical protein
MTYSIRYHCGEKLVGEVEKAATLDEARRLIDLKAADLDFPADLAVISRVCPSGDEELEESQKLRASLG